jgi:hypothetical protein
MQRRDFIKNISLISAGGLIFPSKLFADGTKRIPIPFGTGQSSASSYSYIASISATANSPYNTVTTGSINTSGANLLVVVLAAYVFGTGIPPSTIPTDSKGNTYTLAKAVSSGGVPILAIYYCYSPTVGSGHTFTYPTVGSSAPSITAYAFSGATSSPLDQTNSFAGTGYTGTSTMQTGSVTPTTNGQLVFTGINAYIASSSPTIDSSFVTPLFQATNAGHTYSSACSYIIQGTASAVNPTWTFNPGASGVQACSAIVTFK